MKQMKEMVNMNQQQILRNPFEMYDRDGYLWLKGNLHSHTTNSDGRISPQERVDGYARNGYDFLCVSDHRKITHVDSLVVPEGLTLIPGVELHPENPFGGKRFHFLALNTTEDLDADKMPPQHVIDAVNNQGGSIWLAHPYWSSVNIIRDVLPLKGLAGIEVYNTACRCHGRGESGVHWDDWMDLTERLLPALANDDSHGADAEKHDTYQSWTMVRVKERTVAAILEALVTGASYSTTGPEIHDIQLHLVDSDGNGQPRVRATLRSSPARRIIAVCNNRGIEYHQGGELFESASFNLPSNVSYVRFEIVSEDGSKAWSNPFDLSGISAC